MDTVIKDKEIQYCIAKLKINNSSGFDTIRNKIWGEHITALLKKYKS